MGNDTVLAVDIGGSKIDCVLINSRGILLSDITTFRVPFKKNGVADEKAIIDILVSQAMDSEIRAVGISLCGNVDIDSGEAILVPNLHWKHVPFSDMVSEKLQVPVFAATDVRQALIAELLWGKAKDCKFVAWATIGTGYGGYLYLDGRLYDGYHGFAGNFGHNSSEEVNGYLCGCGKQDCFETYVAGPAIARAGQLICDNGESLVLEMMAEGGDVTTKIVFEAEAENDPGSIGIIDDVIRRLSISLSGLVNVLDLELIILGGGVVNGRPDFVDRISRNIRQYLMTDEAKRDLRIELESFENAALFGAGADAFQRLGIIDFIN